MEAPAAANIVIVDDNLDDIYFFTRALRKAGAAETLRTFDNPHDARAFLASAEAASIRLLLLDIKMPVLSGFELLEWARAQPHLAAIPIVMLSGSSADLDRDKAIQFGATGYLVKPPKPDQVAALLRGEMPAHSLADDSDGTDAGFRNANQR